MHTLIAYAIHRVNHHESLWQTIHVSYIRKARDTRKQKLNDLVSLSALQPDHGWCRGRSRADQASLVEVECTLQRANAHGRMGNSNVTSSQRGYIQECNKMTLLGNSSLQGTEKTHYIIVHAKMVLEMINTRSES